MKTKYLAIINVLTFLSFSVYFYINTTDCVAYFMHDAAVDISAMPLITTCAWFFIGPAIIQFLQRFITRKVNVKVLIALFFLELASMGFMAFTINQPCEFINGGHYMMIDTFGIGISYLLRLVFYLVFGLTAIWTIINLMVPKNRDQMKN